MEKRKKVAIGSAVTVAVVGLGVVIGKIIGNKRSAKQGEDVDLGYLKSTREVGKEFD